MRFSMYVVCMCMYMYMCNILYIVTSLYRMCIHASGTVLS